ncbi:MAG: winged helix-turn-helix transcriptional regulator [Halobacteriovoraceae bacterium]|nr:winged helix-turn-helix transcriptional regulator [Halobacteriovoraceae bacterium]
MNTVSEIGSLLKKIYRIYSTQVLKYLESKGFSDLRASFLEILIFVAETDGPSLKMIGSACNLKKQTMTSHVNELVKRGYLKKVQGVHDKREQRIYFTELGERFRMSLREAIVEIESQYIHKIGEVELLRIKNMLNDFYEKL